eukprot:1353479-Amorphochlora_amoeboformis.AAC.1
MSPSGRTILFGARWVTYQVILLYHGGESSSSCAKLMFSFISTTSTSSSANLHRKTHQRYQPRTDRREEYRKAEPSRRTGSSFSLYHHPFDVLIKGHTIKTVVFGVGHAAGLVRCASSWLFIGGPYPEMLGGC